MTPSWSYRYGSMPLGSGTFRHDLAGHQAPGRRCRPRSRSGRTRCSRPARASTVSTSSAVRPESAVATAGAANSAQAAIAAARNKVFTRQGLLDGEGAGTARHRSNPSPIQLSDIRLSAGNPTQADARASPARSRRSRRSAASSGLGSHCASSGRSSDRVQPEELREQRRGRGRARRRTATGRPPRSARARRARTSPTPRPRRESAPPRGARPAAGRRRSPASRPGRA